MDCRKGRGYRLTVRQNHVDCRIAQALHVCRLPVVLDSSGSRLVQQTLQDYVRHGLDYVSHRLSELPERGEDPLPLFNLPAVAQSDCDEMSPMDLFWQERHRRGCQID